MAEEVILPLFNDTNTAITGGAASTGLKIRRGADGYLFDWNDTTFKNTGWTTLSATFTEIDATNLAGYYKKSGIDISGWNDGWYQVIATYTGTPKRNAAEDWLIKGGKIVEQRTADNLDAQVSLTALEATSQSILTDTAVIGALGAGLTAIPWNATWDAEVQSECADALTAEVRLAKLDFIEKWILNKLVESPSGDTVTLYDDDGVTPLKTWAWNSTTKTRGMAT